MTLQEIDKLLDELSQMVEQLNLMLDEEKGGPGSGCNGPNCGRPSEGQGNEVKPTKPRSGIRPSEVNPNRTEIEYDEEPRTRPRSGVRPNRRTEQ